MKDLRLGVNSLSFIIYSILHSGLWSFPNFLLQLTFFQLGAAFYIFPIFSVEPEDVASTAESKLGLVVLEVY